MKRTIILVYGVVSYAIFFGTFCYSAGFLLNFLVPKSIDSARAGSIGEALAINTGLLALFAIQHSVMARPGFKRWWTRIVPPPAERSTYVLLSSLALIFLFWQWRPMGVVIWDIANPVGRGVMYALFATGFLTVLAATFMINHFDLFGLRQVWLNFRGRKPAPLRFVTPGFYRHVRHPLYVGWILFFWSTPTMTVAHFLCAAGITAHILVAIKFEERDLIAAHGRTYAEYRRRVPMLIPSLARRKERRDVKVLAPSVEA